MKSYRKAFGAIATALALGATGCSNAGFEGAQDNNWTQDDSIEGCFDSSTLNYSDTTLTGNGRTNSDFTRAEFTFTDHTDDDVRIVVDIDGEVQSPSELDYNVVGDTTFVAGHVNIPQGAKQLTVTAHPKSSISVDSCELGFSR